MLIDCPLVVLLAGIAKGCLVDRRLTSLQPVVFAGLMLPVEGVGFRV